MCKTHVDVILRSVINDGPGSAGVMTGLDLRGSNLNYPTQIEKV